MTTTGQVQSTGSPAAEVRTKGSQVSERAREH